MVLQPANRPLLIMFIKFMARCQHEWLHSGTKENIPALGKSDGELWWSRVGKLGAIRQPPTISSATLMLDHRLRRWPNIMPTLLERTVSSGQLLRITAEVTLHTRLRPAHGTECRRRVNSKLLNIDF